MVTSKCIDLCSLARDHVVKGLNLTLLGTDFYFVFLAMGHGRGRTPEFLTDLSAINLSEAHVGSAGRHG